MRRIPDDTPAYAREAIASAEVGRPLAASGGLFVVLLVAMSLIEAPPSRSDGSPHHHVNETHMMPVASPPAHPCADTPVAQIGVANPGHSLAAGEPSCVPAPAPSQLTLHHDGAAHPPRG
jgi:hypothetical protein